MDAPNVTAAAAGEAFDDAVWRMVADYTGPVGARCRAAFAEDLDVYGGLGLDARQAAGIIRDRLEDARERFEASAGAFKLLVKSVEHLGSVVNGSFDQKVVVDHMLATKLGLAKIYHDLARLADRAGVEDVANPLETAAMLAESRDALEEWRALHRTP